ncbi:MAG: gliding motility protein GldM [Azospira oryzae]|jgi:gliding motility-associated protein GldM|nr:gliding motility protein GldM [Cytophaga sp.]PZR33633.1 MAG: gliding motility protein GldM [Azospira oryzae]
MAGAKETPRQKLIGMMYLVLLAMLALQVSSAVLEKFAIINVTLEEVRQETNIKNTTLAGNIEKLAAGKTNEKVLKAVDDSKKAREATKTILDKLDKLKTDMIKLSNTDKVDEKVINDHGSKVATMMMDPRATTGKDFEKSLNDFVTTMSSITGEKYEKIAKAPKDIDFFKDDPDHNKKDFITFTFENTPPIAALATISEYQTQILDIENKVLTNLAAKVDATNVKFDKIVPMVKPVSSVVAAGTKYEADMFITASAEGLTPQMFRNGQKIEVVQDPITKVMMGKVSFPASASNYDDKGLSKQTFEATIKIGEDAEQTYKQTIEYFVAKPIIRVTTGNAPTLYLNCGNFVNIEVPSLGTSYNPSFSGKGAEIIKGSKAGQVTIVPKERKVSVTVSNSGAVLGTENFDVKPIPRPHVTKKDQSGKEVDPKSGAKISQLTQLRISVEPDDNFKNEVPKDAGYRVRSMEVLLRRGTAFVATQNTTSELVDVNAWKSQMKPGDVIVCHIRGVTRKTFQGTDEKVDFDVYELVSLQ